MGVRPWGREGRLGSRLTGICGLLATGALLIVLPPAARASLDATEVAKKVQARYDETRDFTADVTQEMTVASVGKAITSHGTIAFKKPGKLRLELTDEDPQTVVADGTREMASRIERALANASGNEGPN